MYKILYNNITIDVLRNPVYCTYLSNGRKLRTDKTSANCIVSSDGSTVYHIAGTPFLPPEYKTVYIIPIKKAEFDYLQSLLTKGESLEEDVQNARKIKIEEMSAESERVIHAGTDITLSDGKTYHFSFSEQDQRQINYLAISAKTDGAESFPWHPDGGDCVFYTKEDMLIIGNAMQAYITYHNSYFHALRNYIQGMSNPLRIQEIKYGDEIPKMYQGEVFRAAGGESK